MESVYNSWQNSICINLQHEATQNLELLQWINLGEWILNSRIRTFNISRNDESNPTERERNPQSENSDKIVQVSDEVL